MERIPILKMGDCLLVTIQVDMHDRLATTLQDDLTERIATTKAKGVVIDISALEIVDSFIGRMLANIAAMSRVLFVLTALRIGAVIAFGLAGSFALALACFWGAGLVGGLAWPITAAWLNQRLDAKVRATVLSMESQANAFGQIAGGPVIGVIGTAGSLRLAMVAVGVALSPLLWLYARAARRAAPIAVDEEVIAVSES